VTESPGATAGRSATELDELELRQRLKTELRAQGTSLEDLSLLPSAAGGGNSGITLLARVLDGDTTGRLVVKVAPPGLEPVRNRDVIRQARLMQALHRDGHVPVPEVVMVSAGDPPDSPPAVAMRFVDGQAVEPGLEARRPPADVVRERYLAAARLLAQLHRIDASQVGLGDEPTLTLRDEITKWTQAFESVEPAYRAGHDEVAPTLVATMPAPVPSTICHGDFRLGNMLCSGTEIRAVIDWEIWSRTDPRLDLTWMLWITDPDHPSAVGPVAGMPSKAELVQAYVDAGGLPVDCAELAWFDAMTCYKQAATIALLAKHGRRRNDGTAPGFERLAPLMIERAARTLRELEHHT
jgi:aminoglycoside phosphotransferase (APT) family kinase protein